MSGDLYFVVNHNNYIIYRYTLRDLLRTKKYSTPPTNKLNPKIN